jgi:hypothetical protein
VPRHEPFGNPALYLRLDVAQRLLFHPSNAITGHKHKNGSNPLSNQTIIDGDGVGDGGTGMNLSFCSNGITSRYAFNCGLSQDSKSLPQTAHSARPGLPSADEDSAT